VEECPFTKKLSEGVCSWTGGIKLPVGTKTLNSSSPLVTLAPRLSKSSGQRRFAIGAKSRLSASSGQSNRGKSLVFGAALAKKSERRCGAGAVFDIARLPSKWSRSFRLSQFTAASTRFAPQKNMAQIGYSLFLGHMCSRYTTQPLAVKQG